MKERLCIIPILKKITALAIISVYILLLQSCGTSRGDAVGSVSGLIALEDGESVAATISFLYSGVEEGRTTTATDGSFSGVNLREGTFSVTASKTGYDSVTSTFNVSGGNNTLPNITLNVSRGDVNAYVIDKTSTAYDPALYLVLDNGTEYATNSNGAITLTNVGYATFAFSGISTVTTSVRNRYFWTVGSEPTFTRKGSTSNYYISLPRALYSDYSAGTAVNYTCSPGAAGCFSGTTQYIAQAITPTSTIDICTLGLGVFNTNPTQLKLHVNNAGAPGAIITSVSLSSYPSSYGRTSEGQRGSLGDLCAGGGSETTLTGGQTYWVVAYFSSVPSSLSVYGSTAASISGLGTLQSADGATWGAASFQSSAQKLNLWAGE